MIKRCTDLLECFHLHLDFKNGVISLPSGFVDASDRPHLCLAGNSGQGGGEYALFRLAQAQPHLRTPLPAEEHVHCLLQLQYRLQRLFQSLTRHLDPELEGSGSLFMGQYILHLILHLPLQMAPHIGDLVAALVGRMQSAKIAGLRSSLLLIFAKLVHMSVPQIEQFIDLLLTIPANNYENALSYVMRSNNILSLLAKTLVEIEEQEEDCDWEEVEDGMDRDILNATAAASSSRPGHDQLQAMARVADEEDDEDDLSGVGDPLHEINLANYLADFLSSWPIIWPRFSQSNKDLLDRLFQYLTPAHRSAILGAISR